ncbi:MAG: acetone carboxylase subunit gamma [Candidatus Bathyarchaeia archaeon]
MTLGYKVKITEYLEIDLEKEIWCCAKCGYELISARENYKKGCLVYDREPSEIWRPAVEGQKEYSLTYSSELCRIVEFYCPNCGTLIETEVLPPGHPITHDIEPDLDALKERFLGKRGSIRNE